MADATIISLPALTIQSLTDLKETSANGNGSYKETRQQELNFMSANVQIAELQVTNLISDLSAKLNLSGGTMTGFLTLNADPTTNLEAVTKQYVDNSIASGPYLKIVNNLSDVANVITSAQNIGASNSYIYIFSNYILTAPLPRRIGVSLSASGQTLQLPDATTLNSNVIGDLFFIDNFSVYPLSILDGTGSPIFTVNPSSRYFYTPDTNGTVAGIWYFWPWIGSINGSTKTDNIVDLNSVYAQTSAQNLTISSGLNLLNGNVNIGTSTSNAFALLQLVSTTQGFSPPNWTSIQESMNISSLGSGNAGLSWFNSNLVTQNYWSGLDVQHLLTVENCIQGTNMSLDTSSYPGKIVFNASGGSGPSEQVNGSFSVNKSATFFTPLTSSFTAVGIDATKFIAVHQNGVSVTTATIDSVTTPIMINTSSGGTRYCIVTYDLGIGPSLVSGQTYTFCIAIQRNGGPLVLTSFSNNITIPTTSSASGFKPISISGEVDLGTNDYVYLTVLCDTATQSLSAYYFNATLTDTTIANLPSTNALMQGTSNLYLSQNGGANYQYLSGSATIGDIAQFNSPGGQLIDSGIAASNIVQNNGSTYNINISGNASTVTTNANLTGSVTSIGNATILSNTGIGQVIAITQVTGSTQIMTDSAPINRYILQNSSICTLTLPTSINTGHSFEIVGGRIAGWIIAQNSGQSVAFGTQTTTSGPGGSLSSTYPTDSIILACVTADTQLTAYGVQGNPTYV